MGDLGKNGLGLDFNPTFSRINVPRCFTLAHPNPQVRDFWIEHGKRSRRIAEYFGRELGQVAVNNFWVPDGFKDNPVDRLTPRSG